jgi:hypothetical protein
MSLGACSDNRMLRGGELIVRAHQALFRLSALRSGATTYDRGSSMNVKAQGLLNAAKYIEERHGRDALGEILRECSGPVRETFTTAIAINWHPAEELCELVEVAASKLGVPLARFAQDVGAAGARANMKGMLLRFAFYWGKPDFLMKRAAGLWRQFNDEGSMTLLEMDARVIRMEVRGLSHPRTTFCAIINGWFYETAVALGIKHARSEHVECRARSGARCIYEVRGQVMPDSAPRGEP